MESYALLDSFQLIVAVYLFYVAIKGSGQFYRFGGVDEEEQRRIRRPLRLLYAAAGVIALLEFAVSSLQSSLFTRTVVDDELVITQTAVLDFAPFLTYRMLTVLSNVLTILLVALLAFVFIWMYRLGRRGEK